MGRRIAPEIKKAVVRMVVIDGISRREAAKTMGVSTVSVERWEKSPLKDLVIEEGAASRRGSEAKPSELDRLRAENSLLRSHMSNLMRALDHFMQPAAG